MDLVEVLTATTDTPPVRLVYGTVTQASPLLVQVGGSTVSTSAKRLASYTPTLADVVAVLVAGEDRLVLGKPV